MTNRVNIKLIYEGGTKPNTGVALRYIERLADLYKFNENESYRAMIDNAQAISGYNSTQLQEYVELALDEKSTGSKLHNKYDHIIVICVILSYVKYHFPFFK